MRPAHPWLFFSLSILLVLLTACSLDEVIGTDRDVPPAVSPTAIAALPDDMEEVTLIVANGTFDVDDVHLLKGAPTILHITNTDGREYRLRIVEDLVTATPIPAHATTDVEFTTPNAAVYEGQLLSAERDEVLDTVRVVVRSAGAVEP